MIRFGTILLPDPFKMTRHDSDIEIEFRKLTAKEKDALAAFFKDDAQGTRAEWEYRARGGDTRRVRFNEAALVFVQFAKDAWDTTLALIVI